MGHLYWRSGQTGLLRRMATPQILAARMHRFPLRMHAIAAWLRHGETTLKTRVLGQLQGVAVSNLLSRNAIGFTPKIIPILNDLNGGNDTDAQ
jgi:hypothetical protein